MYHLTHSIFNAFNECPAKALAMYKGRIIGNDKLLPEWESRPNESMASGSLVDAMVTKQFKAEETDDKIMPKDFYPALASSYDNGMKNASLLTNKKGGWNAAARTAIKAAKRLLADENAQRLLKGALFQSRISYPIGNDTVWEGDIDILKTETSKDRNGNPSLLRIVDLKSPASTNEGWIISQGKNVKVPWYMTWQYWFQLASYAYAFSCNDAELNGKQLNMKTVPAQISLGLLYASREEVPEIGYVPIPGMVDVFLNVVNGNPEHPELSRAGIIRAIVDGSISAPACGKCDYCRAHSKVVIPEPGNEEYEPQLVSDIYGVDAQ